MATIKQRLKEIAYIKDPYRSSDSRNQQTPKNEEVVFLICEELNKDDFKKPFFKGVINLYDGFKFLSYCGKDQKKNLNKNALVIQKKLSKDGLILYRVYLMDKEGFNIRELFKSLEFNNNKYPCEENGYRLDVGFYVNGGLKEEYKKEELIYILNKIQNKLIEWSVNKKELEILRKSLKDYENNNYNNENKTWQNIINKLIEKI